MNESTTVDKTAVGEVSQEQLLLETASWNELVPRLPVDLDSSAKTAGALLRRRGIRSAKDLLRMIFAYAVCDWSLRLVGAWLATLGLAEISDVAILDRIKNSQRWLGWLVGDFLNRRQTRLSKPKRVRLRIVDATELVDSRHHNWFVHACLDLGEECLAGVEVTDAHSGESLARFPGQPGEIVLGDRGYAHAKGLGASLASGAELVVRCHWRNLVLEQADGRRLDVLGWLRTSSGSSFGHPIERRVWLTTPAGRFPLRLIAAALPQEALERARQRVQETARKKGRTSSQDNLFAAGFILVLTNLPADTWLAEQVLELYRLRWQVEVLFKRYKSIFQLDQLRAHDPELVQTYLLAKLLAAFWLEELVYGTQAILAEWFADTTRPVSVWRLYQWTWAQFRSSIQGHISWSQLVAALPRLERFFRDTHRRRPQQLAAARAFLAQLAGTCHAEP